MKSFNLPEPSSLNTWSTSANDHWLKLVQSYSDRKLSHPNEDKFAALSGVAERMAVLCNDEYVAGLFRKGLPRDLLWQIGGTLQGHNATRSQGPYRAPTWSWASMDGLVVFPSDFADKQRILAEVLDVRVGLSYQDNPYGQITGANLVLRGPFLRCTWTTDQELEGRPVSVITFPNGHHVAMDESWGGGWQRSYFDIDTTHLDGDKDFGLLFITSMNYRGFSEPPERGIKVKGLMLMREGNADDWCRAGAFEIIDYAHNGLRFREVLDDSTCYQDVRII